MRERVRGWIDRTICHTLAYPTDPRKNFTRHPKLLPKRGINSTTPSVMRVAVLFAGLMRCWEEGYSSHPGVFSEAASVSSFACVHERHSVPSGLTAAATHHLRPPSEDLQNLFMHNTTRHTIINHVWSMFYGDYCAFQLLESQMTPLEENGGFDVVVRYRMETQPLSSEPSESVLPLHLVKEEEEGRLAEIRALGASATNAATKKHKRWVVWVPDGYDYGGLNDQIAFGRPEAMRVWSDLFLYLPYYANQFSVLYHPETLRKFHATYHGIEVRRFRFSYRLAHHFGAKCVKM
jgi:hypothetical protein